MSRRALPPSPQFGGIHLDVPWPEHGGGKVQRGADRHYALLKVADAPAIIRGSGLFRPAPDCHMYLWATNNHLPDALWLMGQLGFRYVTKVTWPKERREPYRRCLSCGLVEPDDMRLSMCPKRGVHRFESASVVPAKQKFGLGQYFRGADECLLFGVRGNGLARRTAARSLTTLLHGPLREHSRKPDSAYELVESRTVGPYLDLFASDQHLQCGRSGWQHWGLTRSGEPALPSHR